MGDAFKRRALDANKRRPSTAKPKANSETMRALGNADKRRRYAMTRAFGERHDR